MTHPCETLEQRWSVCRDGYQPWLQWRAGIDTCLEWWGPPQRDIGQTRPCTSPRRNGCRAGLTQFHGYFTREAWRWQQREAGRRDFAHTDWDRSYNPLSGVRASDWLKELE